MSDSEVSSCQYSNKPLLYNLCLYVPAGNPFSYVDNAPYSFVLYLDAKQAWAL